MEYRILNGTGIEVSRVSLGTITFGAQVDETSGIEMVEYAIDNGINFIDTADLYQSGEAERILGKALKGKRDEVVLASKVGQLGKGLHRKNIMKGVEDSLTRLGTDYLDICYLHEPDRQCPLEESLSAMDRLVREGKVLYVGTSNFPAWLVSNSLSLSDKRNFCAPVVTQVIYNLLARAIETELVPFCESSHTGITVWNPLAGGFLTGKYTSRSDRPKNTRFEKKIYMDRYWNDANWGAVDDLREAAKDAGKNMLELAIQWLAAQSFVDSIIVGVSRLEQLKENIVATEGKLDNDTLRRCDQAWGRIKGRHPGYIMYVR